MKRALLRLLLNDPTQPPRFRVTVEGEEPLTYEWSDNGLAVLLEDAAEGAAKRIRKPHGDR